MARSLAEQTEAELGGAHSVLALQKRDHQVMEGLLERIERGSGVAREKALTALCRLVFPHAFAEEAVLWPVLRRALPDGEALTLHVEQEHQQINELFTALETLPPDSTEHRTRFGRIAELLRRDARDEEDVLLPKLQAALSVSELRRVGRVWWVVRHTAPTRPHPTVARRPPGNVLAALPLTGLDRARDRLDQAARRVPPRLAVAYSRTSHALAGVAGAVEHLPPLRRGEDPTTRT
ncbi:hemerythrin domain-containing protein [Nocardia sp. CDC159]|uniref:Hemerythrin domain-containing protein n=1 Tax=Nocardia pulmonis TaxID=2951408 RepID=A0A9X2E0Q7_9NOCA|nr:MULTISPECIES: hemerythrin domain-containing protein [Nocardia]MCM6771989.1 hemerythrin domain-containing protein [Nocardia pulmonis]MCM6785353.1 hemerythrin domain-containing protein [Nocardia sp. CDC159]